MNDYNAYYLDTSALVKYYFTEPGSSWVAALIDELSSDNATSLNITFISEIAIVELAAALAILRRQKKLSNRRFDRAYAHFFSDLADGLFTPLTITTKHFYVGAELTRRHPLKAYDALHLAIALEQRQILSDFANDLTFVCGDKSLIAAAKAEGLKTENPFDHAVPEEGT